MKKSSKISFSGLILCLTGIAMVAFGAYKGEMQEVFTKAIGICLECIGIG